MTDDQMDARLRRAGEVWREATPVAGHAPLQIRADHKVTGSGGCNSIGGDVQVTNSTLGLGGGLATTEMACLDDQVTTAAGHVDAMLSGDVRWSISGDELTLTKA